jgi:hypothetical protein
MTATTTPELAQIHALLAEQGYAVSETAADTLSIRQVDSGITIRAVLQGNILFFSLTCTTVPASAVTAELMRRMLASDNGISTSHFQLYQGGDNNVSVTLNNFCVLQDMGDEDEDDILSCVHFLLVDVLMARRVLGNLGA